MSEKKHEDDTRPLSVEETAELLGATVRDDVVIRNPLTVPFGDPVEPVDRSSMTTQQIADECGGKVIEEGLIEIGHHVPINCSIQEGPFYEKPCCFCGSNIPVGHSALSHKDGRIACCGCEGSLKNEELIEPSQMTANMLARVFDCSVNEDGTVTIDPRNFNESYSITIISRDKTSGKITTEKLVELASCLPDNELKRALTWAADRITSLETKLKGLQVKP